MTDRIVRSLSISGGIRILACSVAGLAREVCALQQASPTVSIALGRGLAAGALMGALLKPEQRVAMKFEGNGPMRKMIIEADFDGAVRGSVGEPAADAAPVDGRWNVPGVLGRAGFLTVSKDIGVGSVPYSGMVQLRDSEIGGDLAYYLTDSEQIPSAVGLGAALDENGVISACGGFLVQALPKALESEIDGVMESIAGLAPISGIIADGGPEALLANLWGGLGYATLESRDVFFRCGCFREKVERALLSVGPSLLEEMRSSENRAEVRCEFCGKTYEFSADELCQLAASAVAQDKL